MKIMAYHALEEKASLPTQQTLCLAADPTLFTSLPGSSKNEAVAAKIYKMMTVVSMVSRLCLLLKRSENP